MDIWILNLNYNFQLFFNYYFQWLDTIYEFHVMRRSVHNQFFSLLEEQ